MSRASLSAPTLKLVVLAAGLLFGLMLAAPATAAKPCWEQVIDDWLDNGRLDGVYTSQCVEQARDKVPEDIRAYSDFEEKIDAYLQDDGRSLQNVGGGPKKTTRPNIEQAEAEEIANSLREDDGKGPIGRALNPTPTSAGSVPLPLMILVGLAVVLLTAGAAGFAHRKLAARRASGP